MIAQKNISSNNSHKKLAVFLPGLYGGGAERIMLNLAHGIAERGYAIDLVLAQAEGSYLDQVPESVRLVKLKDRHLKAFRTLASLPALVHYLNLEQPVALISALNHANITALWAQRLARTQQPVVITEHNTFSQHFRDISIRYSWPTFRLVKRFYPWADGIIAVSDGVAEDLAQVVGISRDQIKVIYNPIVTPELQDKAQKPIDHPWFEPGQPPVVLSVGRLTAQKDYSTLIQAFAQVRHNKQLRLLILGEGEERPALEALVRELALEQYVSLPGFVPNPYPYMAQAALFVLSSRWEGLPTVLVEALSCNTPVIATDCPSGPREILRDGQYGRLVPVGDVVSLAQAMEAALDGKTPQPSQESWLPFELMTVVNQYLDILLGSE
jgi:glycosyltransferase involved in cell wall biosynthesis